MTIKAPNHSLVGAFTFSHIQESRYEEYYMSHRVGLYVNIS